MVKKYSKDTGNPSASVVCSRSISAYFKLGLANLTNLRVHLKINQAGCHLSGLVLQGRSVNLIKMIRCDSSAAKRGGVR